MEKRPRTRARSWPAIRAARLSQSHRPRAEAPLSLSEADRLVGRPFVRRTLRRLAVAAAPALPGPASRARAAAPYCGSGAGTLPRAPRGLRLMVIAAAFGAPNRRPNDQTQADRRTKVKRVVSKSKRQLRTLLENCRRCCRRCRGTRATGPPRQPTSSSWLWHTPRRPAAPRNRRSASHNRPSRARCPRCSGRHLQHCSHHGAGADHEAAAAEHPSGAVAQLRRHT